MNRRTSVYRLDVEGATVTELRTIASRLAVTRAGSSPLPGYTGATLRWRVGSDAAALFTAQGIMGDYPGAKATLMTGEGVHRRTVHTWQ